MTILSRERSYFYNPFLKHTRKEFNIKIVKVSSTGFSVGSFPEHRSLWETVLVKTTRYLFSLLSKGFCRHINLSRCGGQTEPTMGVSKQHRQEHLSSRITKDGTNKSKHQKGIRTLLERPVLLNQLL